MPIITRTAEKDAAIIDRLLELPWGEDADINGGDLVNLVGQLLDQPGYLQDEVVTKSPGFNCQLGPGPGLVTHRRWGDAGDCDEHGHGVITDARTGKVVGNLATWKD